jgi:hypothetical protein
MISFDLIRCVSRHVQQYFNYIMATSFSGGGSRSIQRKPPTMSKQLVNFIICGCESNQTVSTGQPKSSNKPKDLNRTTLII